MTLKQAIGVCSKTNYRVIYTGTCRFCKSTFFYSYALERRQGFCSHTCASRFNFSKSSITFKCFNCKKIVVRAKSHYTRRKTNFCNFKCWTNYSQNNFPNRKNGTINNWGYRMFYQFKKSVPEHRIIMEKYVGRKLGYNEIIHHINHDKLDNRIDNLQIMSRGEHSRLHLTKPLKEFECRICKAIFKRRNRKDRPNYFCSRKCLYSAYTMHGKNLPFV